MQKKKSLFLIALWYIQSLNQILCYYVRIKHRLKQSSVRILTTHSRKIFGQPCSIVLQINLKVCNCPNLGFLSNKRLNFISLVQETKIPPWFWNQSCVFTKCSCRPCRRQQVLRGTETFAEFSSSEFRLIAGPWLQIPAYAITCIALQASAIKNLTPQQESFLPTQIAFRTETWKISKFETRYTMQ